MVVHEPGQEGQGKQSVLSLTGHANRCLQVVGRRMGLWLPMTCGAWVVWRSMRRAGPMCAMREQLG